MRAIQAGAPPGERRAATPVLGVLLIWLATALLMLLATGGKIGPAWFLDGDDALRLQQVRDLLAGQGWFDLHQYRIAPPDGVAMHWTRVVDLPIAAVILILRPLLGQPQAEVVAMTLIPLLGLLSAMLLSARLAARQFGSGAGLIAALMVAAAIPASFRMMPMRIDHHAWQFVLALVALNGMAARTPKVGGAVAGLALALALGISLESLPLTVIFAGLCTLRLWRGQREWLGAYMAALALASAVLLLFSRGLSDIADHCDALSPVHVLVLLWVAGACALVLPRLRHRPPGLSLVALGAIGAGAIAIMAMRAPQCLGSDAFAALDPLVKRVWLDSVVEGLPVWRQGLVLGATIILLPLFGLIACIRLRLAANDQAMRDWWTDMALLLAGATLVGLLVARASGVSCLFATIPAAWQFQCQVQAWRADRLVLRRLARIALLIGLIMPGALVGMAASALPRKPAPPSSNEVCKLPEFLPALARLPAATVLSGLDLGPAILVTTPHTVVATGHHRASAAMRDLLLAFLGPDEGAREIMARRGARVVVICAKGAETRLYRRLAPNGFMAHLADGKAPSWLEPLPLAPQSGISVWVVRPQPAPRSVR
ncbi:MAG: hypothetical protein ACKOVA_16525 [Novosphingobium sp.]